MEHYLNPIRASVEEADATHVGQDGVSGVIQHVMSGHWGKAVSLSKQKEKKLEQSLYLYE